MRDVLEIETERLSLRPLRAADAARVASFVCDFDVSRMVSSIPHPYPPSAADAWIMTLKARAALAREHVFAVVHPEEGLIGAVGAHKLDDGGHEIGYWIGRPFWGEGYASEAVRGFVSQAKSLGPLEASHFVDNPASGRVLEKVGFTYTGEVRPVFSMARGAKTQARRMRYDRPKPRREAQMEAACC